MLSSFYGRSRANIICTFPHSIFTWNIYMTDIILPLKSCHFSSFGCIYFECFVFIFYNILLLFLFFKSQLRREVHVTRRHLYPMRKCSDTALPLILSVPPTFSEHLIWLVQLPAAGLFIGWMPDFDTLLLAGFHPALCCCLGSSRGLWSKEEGAKQRKDRMGLDGAVWR